MMQPLQRLLSLWAGDEGMDETHLTTFHSISNHAQGKRSRNSISSAARFFFLMSHAETVRRSRYMI